MTPTPAPTSSTGTAERERRPSASFVIVAVGLMAFTAVRLAWLGWKHDPAVQVPAPVAYILSLVLLVGAAMVVLEVLGRGEHLEWLVVPVLFGMAATSGWIGLRGQERYCSTRGPLWLPLPSCRAAFSAGAVILLLMAAMAARGAWRRWRFVASRRLPHAE